MFGVLLGVMLVLILLFVVVRFLTAKLSRESWSLIARDLNPDVVRKLT